MRNLNWMMLTLLCVAAGCNDNSASLQDSRSESRLGRELPRTTTGPAADQKVGHIKAVFAFYGPMPTGVTVSHSGRVFVNFPRWGDNVEFTVAEIRNDHADAFPSLEMNRVDESDARHHLVSVQSVVIDPKDRLWILDTGSINFQPTKPGGPKLIGVDLTQNKIFKTIEFPSDVALPTSYLNDVRFDLTRGQDGLAFITDSSDSGPNGIIVVDLASGKSWRKLNDHPSTKAVPEFVPIVEGEPLLARPKDGPEASIKMGSDGIAISNDGQTLFYTPLASRHLYSVSVDASVDQNSSDSDVAKTVKDLGDRGYASDGLESDASGHLYLSDYENNAIHRRTTTGQDQIIAQDPRMIWPDTLSVAADGYLYFTCNQLNRQPRFHKGQDLRQQPYVLFRTRIDAKPVMLAN